LAIAEIVQPALPFRVVERLKHGGGEEVQMVVIFEATHGLQCHHGPAQATARLKKESRKKEATITGNNERTRTGGKEIPIAECSITRWVV